MVLTAQIEADVSRLEKEEKNRASLLKEAITDMEQGVVLSKKLDRLLVLCLLLLRPLLDMKTLWGEF